MNKGYDNVSFFYDRLSKLVFGQTLQRAQAYFLSSIPCGSSILIAGGGSGWILEAIAAVHAKGLSITFIDASPKMIALACKRNACANQVVFIPRAIEKEALANSAYDVVITPFFMDNFSDLSAGKIVDALHHALKPGGLWLYTDFRNSEKWWHKWLLKIMYLFFKTFCGIEASRMPDVTPCFAKYGYVTIEKKLFAGGSIESKVYRRPGVSAFPATDSINRQPKPRF